MKTLLPWVWLFWVALLPLPLGGNHPAGVALIGIGAALLLGGRALTTSRRTPIPFWIILPACLAYIGMGCLPWAPTKAPSWLSLLDTLNITSTNTTIYDIRTHLYGIYRWGLYGITFWLAVQWGARPHWRNTLIKTLALAGTAYALYGMYMITEAHPTLFFWPKLNYLKDASGPFVNRNTFATYLALAALCAITWTHQQGRLLLQKEKTSTQRTFTLFLMEQISLTNLLPLFTLICTLSGLFMTHSRAGLASFTLGALLLIFLLTRKHKKTHPHNHHWKRVSLMLFVPLFAWLITTGTQGTRERFETLDVTQDARWDLYTFSINHIKDHPWFGSGFNSFGQIYSQNHPLEIQNWHYRTIEKIHNTYLQLAIELGLPITLLLISSILAACALCIHILIHHKRPPRILALALAASFTTAAHALTDFSLELPSFTLTYLTLIGAAIGAIQKEKNLKKPFTRLQKGMGFCITGCLLWSSFWLWQGNAPTFFYTKEDQALHSASIAFLSERLNAYIRAEQYAPLPKTVQKDISLRTELLKRHRTQTHALYKQTEHLIRNQLQRTPGNAFLWTQWGFLAARYDPQNPHLPTILELAYRTAPAEPQLIKPRLQLAQSLWPRLNQRQKLQAFLSYAYIQKNDPQRAKDIPNPQTY